jgi:hypothetical protein
MAKVTPGSWTLTNSVSPSGEKQAPANSESLARLNASGKLSPYSVMPATNWASSSLSVHITA